MIKIIIAFLGWGSLILFFIFFAWPLVFPGAPFMPSFRRKNKIAAKRLSVVIDFVKEVAPGHKFADLGSGDGRVVIKFAQAGFESIGLEINPLLIWWSRIKIKTQGLKNTQIIQANFWKQNLNQYDVIYIFQLNSVNALLSQKFKQELKPGAIVISVDFFLPGLELIKKEGIFGVYKN